MPRLAIIGGTGLGAIKDLNVERREVVYTPFGEPSGPLTHGVLCGEPVVFLPRHGYSHTIPPHMINYRANLWALKQLEVERILAFGAVGGINPAIVPERLSIPDQIIDYTWGRAHTFYEEDLSYVTHIDFSKPYNESLRQLLLQAARNARLDAYESGVYAAIQGPRLETAAEIDKLERDGCDMVGMTGMPEAALARELEIAYAACALCVNRAAGRGEGEITIDEIHEHLKAATAKAVKLLEALMPLL